MGRFLLKKFSNKVISDFNYLQVCLVTFDKLFLMANAQPWQRYDALIILSCSR